MERCACLWFIIMKCQMYAGAHCLFFLFLTIRHLRSMAKDGQVLLFVLQLLLVKPLWTRFSPFFQPRTIFQITCDIALARKTPFSFPRKNPIFGAFFMQALLHANFFSARPVVSIYKFTLIRVYASVFIYQSSRIDCNFRNEIFNTKKNMVSWANFHASDMSSWGCEMLRFYPPLSIQLLAILC